MKIVNPAIAGFFLWSNLSLHLPVKPHMVLPASLTGNLLNRQGISCGSFAVKRLVA